jgi:thiamine-phosphate pyrophosphorylase
VSLRNKSERVSLLCYVTDRRSLAAAESAEAQNILLQKIAAAAAAGVDWIQIREKDLSGKECSALTREAMQLAASSAASAAPSARGATVHATNSADSEAARVPAPSASEAARARIRTRILINDRLDVALATQAGGVHLGEQSLPPQEARRLANSLQREKDFLIGASCHSLEAAQAAERGGADYLFFGPVFATPSKAAYGAPQGLERLAEVCRAVRLPVLAIGGITLENAAACVSAGASGIAAIRLFQDAPDLAAVVRALRNVSA